MQQSSKTTNNLTTQLQQLPQVAMPKDIFTEIQHGLHKRNFIKKHKFISSFSLLAVLALSLVLFIQKNSIDEKDILIQQLVKRTMQLEQLLIAETPSYSMPGSMITERIVNIESWLAKLDDDIKQTRDKQRLSQLMARKLDLLGDLVLLQRKINQKPDYQKVKPYII
ncbi:hypothetical protein MNBD_GAMMA01-333 [hydrothermal vent metagenome]|uniref:Uncharacterized protein n=1 Tax=hydrothermal vent metagenome TaxID=652676 RepID=A0A3B0W7L2_9ZZZZ